MAAIEDNVPTAYATIRVEPLTPRIGGIVSGVDLTQAVSQQQIDDIRAALLDHQVIFFRNQPLDLETHKALGRRFGELHVHSAMPGLEQHPEVRPIHADEKSKHVAGEEWHTDLSCDRVPPMGSILHLHTLPPLGGDTLFASMYAAYDALSDRMKDYLEGLTATHDGGLAFRRFKPDGKFPISTHPVIARHPETKRKLIYVNRGFTSHINELPPGESAALLSFLYSHVEKPDFQCRFRWEKHSVAFWDNRCAQHLAIWDYYPNVRSGYRVQIRGFDPPFA
jgi:taurine dioxygenase